MMETENPANEESSTNKSEAQSTDDQSSSLSGNGLVSSESFGRHKAPPKCEDPTLRKDAKTTEELSKFAFSPNIQIPGSSGGKQEGTLPAVQSSTRVVGMNGSSTVESRAEKHHELNKRITLQTSSRQGRATQRWLTDAETNQRVRLVTGCVPVLKGGRILFVSASRKLEWILPKGGWEKDETMEESALRETFEEAGVLGVLGPKLSAIQYETRKSKKRRKDMAELLKKSKEINPAEDTTTEDSKESPHTMTSPSTDGSPEPRAPNTETKSSPSSEALLPDAVVDQIRASQPPKRSDRSDETSSNASDSSYYSLVKMTLFPLYVTEIKDSWPESGRFRKILEIDDAIEMMESREEFRSALLEVKEKKLHLLAENADNIVPKE